MQGLEAELIRGMWYVACPGRDVRAGKFITKKLMNEPILIGRKSSGEVFALRDICPHRGIPLSYGHFDGTTLACSYHGWRFDGTGTCVDIPSLREGQQVDVAKIRCGNFACVESQGVVWIYFAQNGETPAEGGYPAPPLMPDFESGSAPKFHIMLPFTCSTDHAAFGLMDPTHAAFVHTSWWFKKQAAKLRPKEKSFAPSELGWSMVRHRLPPQNIAYKLLGNEVTTEITYRLPGFRIENIRGERHQATGLTALTPNDGGNTEVHQFFWVSAGWAGGLRPLFEHLMRVFLDQDRLVVIRQREGLLHAPRLMLVNDADTQARWWARIKDTYLMAQKSGTGFTNPLEPMTLRWRS